MLWLEWPKLEAAQENALFAVITYKGAKNLELLLPFRPKERLDIKDFKG